MNLSRSRLQQNMQRCKRTCKGSVDCALVAGEDILLEPHKHSGYACHKNFLMLYNYFLWATPDDLLAYHHYLKNIDTIETSGVLHISEEKVREKLQIFTYEYIVYLRFIRLRSRQYKEVLTMPNGFDSFISLVLNGRASEVDIENGLRLFGSSERVNHVFYGFLRSIDVRLRAVQVS